MRRCALAFTGSVDVCVCVCVYNIVPLTLSGFIKPGYADRQCATAEKFIVLHVLIPFCYVTMVAMVDLFVFNLAYLIAP